MREVRHALTQRGAAHVVRDRAGDVAAGEACQLCAQGPVNILKKGEEVVVEGADCIQSRSPVHGCAATRPEYRLWFVVLPLVDLAMAPAPCRPLPEEDVPCAINDIAVPEVQKLAAAEPASR